MSLDWLAPRARPSGSVQRRELYSCTTFASPSASLDRAVRCGVVYQKPADGRPGCELVRRAPMRAADERHHPCRFPTRQWWRLSCDDVIESQARVTEIPEHLLKRSQERRAALGGDECAGRRRRASPGCTPRRRTAIARRGQAPLRRPPLPHRPPRRRRQARSALRRGGQDAQEDPVLGDARPEHPAAVGVHVRAFADPRPGGRPRPARRGRAAVRRLLLELPRPPTVRRRRRAARTTARCSRRSRTSRTSSTWCTPASQAYARRACRSTATRSRGAHLGYNGAYMPAQGTTPAARSPRRRSSRSSATSATRSAAPTRTSAEHSEEYEKWCSRGLGDLRGPRGRVDHVRQHHHHRCRHRRAADRHRAAPGHAGG